MKKLFKRSRDIMQKFLSLIIAVAVFLYAFPASADTYGGWDKSFKVSLSEGDSDFQSPDIIILENDYKNSLYSLLQKNKLIETELTIIRIKLSSLETPVYSYDEMGGANTLGVRIANTAAILSGKQYWPNACAFAVNEVLKILGIDITEEVNYNPNWVPNYANLGLKIPSMQYLQPGDLVIYDNAIGMGGYDHIGIYAGNGMAYNVSTSNNYRFVLTTIGSRFMEGRRLDFDGGGNIMMSPIVFKNNKNYQKIAALKTGEYMLKAENSINIEKAHMDYLKKSDTFYNLKIRTITKGNYRAAEVYFRNIKLYDMGCIARKNLEEAKDEFFKTSMARYSLYKEKVAFKMVNVPYSLNIIAGENKNTDEYINMVRFSPVELSKEENLRLSNLERINKTIKLYLWVESFKNNSSIKETDISEFPPLNLGSKESKLAMLEKELKEAEKILDTARIAHEKGQSLYSLGYIAKKDMEELGRTYEKALNNYKSVQEKIVNYRPSGGNE